MKKKTIREWYGIAVLSDGFVFVGNIKKDGKWYFMKNAKNIRKWGTSKGLGELARKGPLENTKLDDYGDIDIPQTTVRFIINTKESLWLK